jgi:oligopeptide transport system substrate-binding protein
VAPAPYFMSVMNRPDGGPQPRHVIERPGAAWTESGKQVVSGPFRQAEHRDGLLVLERQEGYTGTRPGNVRRIEFVRTTPREALEPYRRHEFDVIGVRYTPKLADLLDEVGPDVSFGLPGWTFYLSFDHDDPITGNLEFRRALAHAIDRDALESVAPANLLIATGGLVPPSLQGHTPDIAPRFDPERAREHLRRAGQPSAVSIAAFDDWHPLVGAIVESWRAVLGLDVRLTSWTIAQAAAGMDVKELAPIVVAGWLPGYPDPEYFLRLLLHSDALTNEGDFSYPPFDELIERARQERSDRARLELFHEADRMAVVDRVALIPIGYGRAMAYVKSWVKGWWEFGKTSSSFADLVVLPESPRSRGSSP